MKVNTHGLLLPAVVGMLGGCGAAHRPGEPNRIAEVRFAYFAPQESMQGGSLIIQYGNTVEKELQFKEEPLLAREMDRESRIGFWRGNSFAERAFVAIDVASGTQATVAARVAPMDIIKATGRREQAYMEAGNDPSVVYLYYCTPNKPGLLELWEYSTRTKSARKVLEANGIESAAGRTVYVGVPMLYGGLAVSPSGRIAIGIPSKQPLYKAARHWGSEVLVFSPTGASAAALGDGAPVRWIDDSHLLVCAIERGPDGLFDTARWVLRVVDVQGQRTIRAVPDVASFDATADMILIVPTPDPGYWAQEVHVWSSDLSRKLDTYRLQKRFPSDRGRIFALK